MDAPVNDRLNNNEPMPIGLLFNLLIGVSQCGCRQDFVVGTS